MPTFEMLNSVRRCSATEELVPISAAQNDAEIHVTQEHTRVPSCHIPLFLAVSFITFKFLVKQNSYSPAPVPQITQPGSFFQRAKGSDSRNQLHVPSSRSSNMP